MNTSQPFDMNRLKRDFTTAPEELRSFHYPKKENIDRDRFNSGAEYTLNMAQTFVFEFFANNRPSVTTSEFQEAFNKWIEEQRKSLNK